LKKAAQRAGRFIEASEIMENLPHIAKLHALGYQGKYHYLEEAFSRNRGFLTAAEQDRLFNATVAIPGLGGVGGAHLITLTRMGVGRFHLADFDIFEPANVNRQYGAKVRHFGRAKLDVMVEEALNINPYLEIRKFPGGVHGDNLDTFLDGVDVVVDGIDFFNFDVRRMVFKRARSLGIPVVTAGPLGYSAALLVFAPDRGLGFDAYFDIRDDMPRIEQLIAFMVGLAPRATQKAYLDPRSVDLAHQRGPSLGAGCEACASAAAAEVARLLLGRKGLRPVPCYAQYDPYTGRFHRGYLFLGNRHPLQRLKRRLLKRQVARSEGCPTPAPVRAPQVAGLKNEIPPPVMDYLIRAAIQAPSGDNCQPWRFRAGRNRIDILLDPEADHSPFNVNQTASLIACGAALENLLIAASRYGLQGDVAYRTEETDLRLRICVGLNYREIDEDPLQRFIWERHTNRTPYRRHPLPPEIPVDLIGSLDQFPGMDLRLYQSREDIRTIARLVYQADRTRVTTRGLHEQLMRMIRFTDEEVVQKRDGLPLKNLEAGPSGEMFLRLTRDWSMMQIFNRLGLSRIVPLIAYQGVLNASLVGLLKCPDTRAESLIEGGRALERIWLTAARKGLSFQPMTAITLFWMRWRMQQLDALGTRQSRLLSSLWPAYHEIFRVPPESPEGHVMLFRIGVGRPVVCRTLRKTPEALQTALTVPAD
jgi:molybdopterin/thiamine biosynthesis adenylyltransferase